MVMCRTSGAIQQGVPTKVLRVLGPRQSSSRSGVAAAAEQAKTAATEGSGDGVSTVQHNTVPSAPHRTCTAACRHDADTHAWSADCMHALLSHGLHQPRRPPTGAELSCSLDEVTGIAVHTPTMCPHLPLQSPPASNRPHQSQARAPPLSKRHHSTHQVCAPKCHFKVKKTRATGYN
jgi:uncharacterized membrane protein